VKPRAVDIRDIVLVGLATVLAVVLTPSLTFVGVPIGALATGWLSYRYGPLFGAVAAVLATAAVTLAVASFAPEAISSALFTGPALLAAGPGAVWALRRWKTTSVIAALAAVLFVALVTVMTIQASALHTTITAQFAQESQRSVNDFLAAFSVQSDQAAALRKDLAAQVDRYVMLWPSALFVTTAFVAAITVPAVSWLGRKAGEEVSVLPPLAELDLSFHLVWPAIVGLALLAADGFLKQSSSWMWVVGANLLIAVRPALFAQGLGSFAALYRRVGVGGFGRSVGFLLLGISELAVPSVSIVGLADMFFNLRKVPRGQSGAPAGAA
jgi:uncharacterized protein YybS (DUF2232 family)